MPHGEENKRNYDYDRTHTIPCEIRKKRPQEKEKKGIVIRTLPLPQRGETRDDDAGDDMGDESAGALTRLCLSFVFALHTQADLVLYDPRPRLASS